jgi:hypothetical protein
MKNKKRGQRREDRGERTEERGQRRGERKRVSPHNDSRNARYAGLVDVDVEERENNGHHPSPRAARAEQENSRAAMTFKNYFQTNPSSKTKASERNISIIRHLLIVSLTVSGVLCGGLTYYVFGKYEAQLAKGQFSSSVRSHFGSLTNFLDIQFHVNFQYAATIGVFCPSQSDWPNCTLPYEEVTKLTNSLHTLSKKSAFLVTPIVTPEQRQDFETFARKYYQTDGHYPNGTGATGIFALGPNSTHVKSTGSPERPYDIFLPILLVSNVTVNSQTLLYDVYSNPMRQSSITHALDCIDERLGSGSELAQQQCSAFMDDNNSEDLTSFLATPIFPQNDPSVVVGFSGSKFSWETALSSKGSENFDFQCEITSSTSSVVHTYLINHGKAKRIDRIKEYPHSNNLFYSQLKQSFVLLPEEMSSSETVYTITYYSDEETISQLIPAIACLCCFGITLFLSMVFLFFDALIKREALDSHMLLDSKRTYVRFISHEIRYQTTPDQNPTFLSHIFLFHPSLSLSLGHH